MFKKIDSKTVLISTIVTFCIICCRCYFDFEERSIMQVSLIFVYYLIYILFHFSLILLFGYFFNKYFENRIALLKLCSLALVYVLWSFILWNIIEIVNYKIEEIELKQFLISLDIIAYLLPLYLIIEYNRNYK